MFKMFQNEEYPLEKYILDVLNKNKYDVDVCASIVYTKYPFVKKGDLKKVIAELILKKVNNEKLGGVWIKEKNKFKMVAKNYLDLARDKPPAWKSESKIPTKVGRANHLAITPMGQDVDLANTPTLDEVEQIEDIEKIYEQMKDKFKKALDGITNKQLEEVVKDEMKRLGFDITKLHG